MAKSRTVGKGRGSVFAGGKVYLEGATIPDDVEVGDHVFTDAPSDEGNTTITAIAPVTVGAGEAAADDTVDGVLGRVGDDPGAAAEALAAEQAKDKPRKTLVDKLQAIVDSAS